MSELLPQEQAKEIINEAKLHINRRERDILELKKRGEPALKPLYDKANSISPHQREQIKSWENEISETKTEAKKEIDKLTLPEADKEKYKNRIDGNADIERTEQKKIFERNIREDFTERANQKPPSKDKDDLER